MVKEDYDNAIDDYTRAIQINPEDPRAIIPRGHAWVSKREYDKAVVDYTTSIRLDPKYSRHNGRGNACRQGRYRPRIARLQRGDPADRDTLPSAVQSTRKYDRAITDYGEAIRVDPKYARRTQACTLFLESRLCR